MPSPFKKNPTVEKRALTVTEFCDGYGVSKFAFYKMLKAGTLRTIIIGGRRLVPVDVAEALLKGDGAERDKHLRQRTANPSP
jgi:hypothetical protein